MILYQVIYLVEAIERPPHANPGFSLDDDIKDPPTPVDVSPDAVFKVVILGA